MKNNLILMIGTAAVAGLVYCVAETNRAPLPPEADTLQKDAAADSTTATTPSVTARRRSQSAVVPAVPAVTAEAPEVSGTSPVSIAAAPTFDPGAAARIAFRQSMDTLESPRSTYEERQAAWKQLKNAGQLDQVISELQERMAADPQNPEYASALGQADLKKCSQTDDIREKAILAMNADQLLDTALNLNPTDWDARYTKAVAMSYWPASLNKGQDVVNNFLTLIQQQEAQPQQPQFAQTYLHLGEQYQSMGNSDYAQQVWARGAQIFPGNADLQNKLAATK